MVCLITISSLQLDAEKETGKIGGKNIPVAVATFRLTAAGNGGLIPRNPGQCIAMHLSCAGISPAVTFESARIPGRQLQLAMQTGAKR